jgi:hypothetical protein
MRDIPAERFDGATWWPPARTDPPHEPVHPDRIPDLDDLDPLDLDDELDDDEAE